MIRSGRNSPILLITVVYGPLLHQPKCQLTMGKSVSHENLTFRITPTHSERVTRQ